MANGEIGKNGKEPAVRQAFITIGAALAAGLLSMYVTQAVVLSEIDHLEDDITRVGAQSAARHETQKEAIGENRRYTEAAIDRLRLLHSNECGEVKQDLLNIKRDFYAPVIRHNGGP